MKRRGTFNTGMNHLEKVQEGSRELVSSTDLIREKIFLLAFSDMDSRNRDSALKAMITEIESSQILNAIAGVNKNVHHILLQHPNLSEKTREYILKNTDHSREMWEYAKTAPYGSNDFDILLQNGNSGVRELMVKRYINENSSALTSLSRFSKDDSKQIRVLVAQNNKDLKLSNMMLYDEDDEVVLASAQNPTNTIGNIIKAYKKTLNGYLAKVITLRMDAPRTILEIIAEEVLSVEINSENKELAENLSKNPNLKKNEIRVRLSRYLGSIEVEFPPF